MGDDEVLRIVNVSLDESVEAWFDDSSRSDGPESAAPRFVLVCGTPASGKTRLRHTTYARGYVTVDAGDIFRRLPDHEEMDFPGEHAWILDAIGTAVATQALEERRHIVTEVFGLDQPATVELLEAMKAAGYRTEVVGVRASVEQSTAWNEERGLDNVSSYFTDEFNVRWLRDVARDFVESKENEPRQL
jgi:dephospho-CoA kinase